MLFAGGFARHAIGVSKGLILNACWLVVVISHRLGFAVSGPGCRRMTTSIEGLISPTHGPCRKGGLASYLLRAAVNETTITSNKVLGALT